MSKRAIILAGGKGTRLRPYTVVLPKPLMPIGEYPILEVIIRQLARNGFEHITLTVNHQVEIIRAFFGNGDKWNVKIDYSFEDRPLSTMGPLKLIHDLPDNFLIMNGDILTDLNYSELFESHTKEKRLFTIAAHSREQKVDYGVLDIDGSSCLSGFREKPVHHYLVSMGIYVANKKILESIPQDRAYGFDNLMLDLLHKQEKVNVIANTCYWLDIGRPDDYMIAIEQFEQFKEKFLK